MDVNGMIFWNYNSVPLPSSTGYTHQRFGWLSISLHYVAFIAQPMFILYADPHWNLMFGRVDTKFDMIRTKCKLLWIFNSQLVCDSLKWMVGSIVKWVFFWRLVAPSLVAWSIAFRRRSLTMLLTKLIAPLNTDCTQPIVRNLCDFVNCKEWVVKYI